jgi:hypothetical protein
MDSRAPRENDNDGKRRTGIARRYVFAHAANDTNDSAMRLRKR